MSFPSRLFAAVLPWAILLLQPPAVEYFTLSDPEPPRGILSLILESFALAGALVLGTVIVGLGFGLFRVWLLRRHPNNRFNGSGRDLPRLDLS